MRAIAPYKVNTLRAKIKQDQALVRYSCTRKKRVEGESALLVYYFCLFCLRRYMGTPLYTDAYCMYDVYVYCNFSLGLLSELRRKQDGDQTLYRGAHL